MKAKPPPFAITPSVKFIPISIRLHPLALERVKLVAKKIGVGYQTMVEAPKWTVKYCVWPSQSHESAGSGVNS